MLIHNPFALCWKKHWKHPLTDTKRLCDKGKLALRTNFDTKLSQLNNRAGLFTFLVALFGLALGSVDNSDTGQPCVVFAARGLASLLLRWHFGILIKLVVAFVLQLSVVRRKVLQFQVGNFNLDSRDEYGGNYRFVGLFPVQFSARGDVRV